MDDDNEETLRRAHRLQQSTFVGHFGFVPRPWEEWVAAHRARSGMGPLWFATLDGADVGFLHETAQLVEDEDAGYVLRLGVEPAARGRSIAKALLHVDSANETGASAVRVGRHAPGGCHRRLEGDARDLGWSGEPTSSRARRHAGLRR